MFLPQAVWEVTQILTSKEYDDDDGNNGTCLHQYAWANSGLGYCVTDTLQLMSLLCGLASIACWMVAQMPQLIKNWRAGNAEGLSLIFLADWLCGDVTNLVGVILTIHQHAITQLYIAVYYVIIDSSMLIQFLYYQSAAKKRKQAAALMVVPVVSLAALYFAQPSSDAPLLESHGRTLLGLQIFGTPASIAGYTLGWISGLMYFTSRIPQIRKNIQRKSTHGLALSMFVMAVLGNLTYTLSILFKSLRLGFMVSNLPWILGSAGTLMFDFTIFGQFLYYGNKPPVGDEHHGAHEPLLNASDDTYDGRKKHYSAVDIND